VTYNATFGEFGGLGSPHQPFDDTADYKSRIKAGAIVENNIREKLITELNWEIEPATDEQDKYDGIDGWIIGETKIPFQIKARKNTSGNDILWEAVKPWHRNLISTFEDMGDAAFTGKDMKCKAQYLISTSNNGCVIRIRNVQETIDKSKKLVLALIKSGDNFAYTEDGEAKIVKDPSRQANFNMSGNTFKINCFIKPNVYAWKQDFVLENPIDLV